MSRGQPERGAILVVTLAALSLVPTACSSASRATTHPELACTGIDVAHWQHGGIAPDSSPGKFIKRVLGLDDTGIKAGNRGQAECTGMTQNPNSTYVVEIGGVVVRQNCLILDRVGDPTEHATAQKVDVFCP